MKSLKSLLLNRTGQRPFTPTALPSSASAPGLNVNLSATNGTTPSVLAEPLNAVSLDGTKTPPGTSSPYLTARPGIPAWQLAARDKAQHAAKSEEESVQT